MNIKLRRAAATAVLTFAVAVPLTTAAQAADVPARKVASHPCDHGGCWGDHHHHHHDHHLLDADLGLGLL
ncbi:MULTISPECIES: hypothetical protein [Streptomyces]|uniref:hypothetical protein n=1 Tax=Streptomyces sp. SYP-A7185 TaxID=3040076 RepID=UPI0038F7E371